MNKLVAALLLLAFLVQPAFAQEPPYKVYLPFIGGGDGECKAMTKAQFLKQIDEQYDSSGEFWNENVIDPSDDDAPPTPEGVSVSSVVDGILIQVDFGVDKAHLFPRFQEFIVYARPIDTAITDGAIEVCRFSGSSKVWQQPHGGYQGWLIAVSAVTNNEAESGLTDFMPITISTFYDDFKKYGSGQISPLDSLNWLRIATFDTDENWIASYGSLTSETSNFKEGDRGIKVTQEFSIFYRAVVSYVVSLDLSDDGRFGPDDYVVMPIYISNKSVDTVLYIRFVDGVDEFEVLINAADISIGWNYFAIKKSAFGEGGTPDWASIDALYVEYSNNTGGDVSWYMILDDWRIVKASIVDAGAYSDTGDAWQPTGGEWHVFQGDRDGEPPGFNYGQVQIDASEWFFSIAKQVGVVNGRMSGRVRLQYADGLAGLVVRSASDASNALAVILDTAADKLWFVQWIGGGDGAATNMALNPSAEAAGNFGALGGATVTADATYALFGTKAYKVVTTAAAGDGMTLVTAALSNADHFVTFYVYGGDPGEDTLEVSADGGTHWNSCTFIEGRLGWARYEAYIPAAEANASEEIQIQQNDDTARTFYIDAAMVATVDGAAYCDGSLGLHYTWSGTANASTSSRPAGTPVTVASADYTLAYDTDYWLGIDFRDDANERRVIVTLGTTAQELWTADALVLSATTVNLWPTESGIALVCFDCNTRWGEIRAGSPQTADYANRAATAESLETGAINISGDTVTKTVGGVAYVVYSMVYLTTRATSTSWDGDAKSAASGVIDLSSVFSLPAGIKAAICNIYARGAANVSFGLGPNSSNYTAIHTKTQVSNQYIGSSGVVPCDENGDIYFWQDDDLAAVYIEIYGYAL